MSRTARTAQPARRLTALVAAAVLGVVGLTGCSSVEEKVVESAIKKENPDVTDVEVEKDKGLKIESEDGSVGVGSKAELPKGFPKDVPLPQGGELATSMTQGDEMVVMYSVKTIDVAAEQDRIVKALEDAGYTVEVSPMNLGEIEGFSVNAVGHGRTVGVALTRAQGDDARYMYSVRPSS